MQRGRLPANKQMLISAQAPELIRVRMKEEQSYKQRRRKQTGEGTTAKGKCQHSLGRWRTDRRMTRDLGLSFLLSAKCLQ